MKQIVSIVTKPFESPVINFLLFCAANILVYVEVLGALMDVLPPRLSWISNVAFAVCLVAGLTTSILGVRKADWKLDSLKAIVEAGRVTLVGVVIMIGLYTISLTLAPERYITKEQLESAGLNPNQVAQLQQYLKEQGYVTSHDLDNISLTSQQKLAVSKIMSELGYITAADAQNIAQTQIALVVTQTAVARLNSCYITPEAGLGTVAVRKSPSIKSDYAGVLASGQKFHVVGHDGGRVNQDKWWLVEFNDNGNEKQYGWVASWVVLEINELECAKVEKAPGF